MVIGALIAIPPAAFSVSVVVVAQVSGAATVMLPLRAAGAGGDRDVGRTECGLQRGGVDDAVIGVGGEAAAGVVGIVGNNDVL